MKSSISLGRCLFESREVSISRLDVSWKGVCTESTATWWQEVLLYLWRACLGICAKVSAASSLTWKRNWRQFVSVFLTGYHKPHLLFSAGDHYLQVSSHLRRVVSIVTCITCSYFHTDFVSRNKCAGILLLFVLNSEAFFLYFIPQ